MRVEPGEGHHQIAVVRVEVRDRAAGGLLIELLEVGSERHADRVIARATDPAKAGSLLERWLRNLLGPVDAPPIPDDQGGGAETPP